MNPYQFSIKKALHLIQKNPKYQRLCLLKGLKLEHPEAGSKPGYIEDLFDQQLAFINDDAKYKAALCSRRAGKSYLVACYLLWTATRRPDTLSVYIALTRKSAKRIIWNVFKRLSEKYNLGLVFKEADLEIVCPNRSTIFLCGANDENVADTLRGNPYALVCIDECASYRGHISELIDDILIPALLDLRGTVCLIGTPSVDWSSYFYEVTMNRSKGWSTHRWTLFDNPFIARPQEFIDDLKQRKGWAEDNPTLLREYYGQWVRSTDDLIYKFNPLKNVYSKLPPCKLHYVVGMDIGYNDATTIAVLGFNLEYSKNVYVVEILKKTKLIAAEIAAYSKYIVNKYEPISMVADSGALGKMIVQELIERYSLMFKPAEKTGKMAFIEILNSDLFEGRLQVPDDCKVIEEWKELQLIKSGSGKLIEDPSQPNDVADAVLYAWRECKHFLYQEAPKQVEFESGEYYKKQEELMFNHATKQQEENYGLDS